MRRIIYNDYGLKDSDIESSVVRVKAFIINSRNKILLAFNNNTYQFPGGHLEQDEDIDSAIEREIREEVGITVKVEEGPFLLIETYDNNYFNTGKKVLNKIYYYKIITDMEPDFSNVHYDELEQRTDFELFYINYNGLSDFLIKCINNGSINKSIGREMLAATKVYNELYGGD